MASTITDQQRQEGSHVAIPPEDFASRIKNANFYSYRTSQIMDIFDKAPATVPMGINAENGAEYRLVPSPHGLVPHSWGDDYGDDQDYLVETSYLGVNTKVQPRAPEIVLEHERAREEKIKLSDNTSPGFHFHQLGILQATFRKYPEIGEEEVDADVEWVEGEGEGTEQGKAVGEEAWEDVKKTEARAIWVDTDFYFVGELDEVGHISNFWIIYNIFQKNEDGESVEITTDDVRWGMLPSSSRQWSCARLQPRTAFGATDVKVTWADQIYHPIELVECTQGPRGEILRATRYV